MFNLMTFGDLAFYDNYIHSVTSILQREMLTNSMIEFRARIRNGCIIIV